MVEVGLSSMVALYTGGVVPLIAEVMPGTAKTTGMAIVISIGSGLIGSFTPAIATLLIQLTGNRAAPALWLTLMAAIALGAAFAVKRFVYSTTRAAGVPV